jgi:hypothetical protein
MPPDGPPWPASTASSAMATRRHASIRRSERRIDCGHQVDNMLDYEFSIEKCNRRDIMTPDRAANHAETATHARGTVVGAS